MLTSAINCTHKVHHKVHNYHKVQNTKFLVELTRNPVYKLHMTIIAAKISKRTRNVSGVKR